MKVMRLTRWQLHTYMQNQTCSYFDMLLTGFFVEEKFSWLPLKTKWLVKTCNFKEKQFFFVKLQCQVNTLAVTYMQNCVKDCANLRAVIQATEVFEDIHVMERIANGPTLLSQKTCSKRVFCFSKLVPLHF